MKNFVSLLFIILFQLSFGQNIQQERTHLDKAHHSKSYAKQHLKTFEKRTIKKPIILGFKAMAYMVMANHVSNPFKKLSYFKKGKKLLNFSIKKDPKNIELRFLRLMVQEKAPKIAGYRENISDDKKFVLQNLKYVKDKNLRKSILNYKKQKK